MGLAAFNYRRRMAARAAEEAQRVQQTDEHKVLDGYTVAELTAYAKEHGINLGGARNKADIIAAIKAAGDSA